MTSRLRSGILTAVLATLFVPAYAHAQYFGRNKVHYKSFDFQIIKTEHFDVYYYPEERDAAMDAARMVERSYGRLSRVLQHEFQERKPLIVYASHTEFQQTNTLGGDIDESTGGVTEAAKSRMILPFSGSYADFDHVMTHELVHGFQYDVLFRRGVAQEVNPFMVRLPLWFMEGMAEYLSIGTIDAHTQSWLRDAVLNGYLRDIGEMTQRDDYLSYRFGQSLWAYIGSKWGDEAVGILLEKAPRVGIERAFATTLGVSLAELSKEWEADVRRTYLLQVTEHSRPETFAKKLTKHNKLYDEWYLSPAISPDGQTMVYLSQREGFTMDMWLADANTGAPIDRLVSSQKSADFESFRYMSSAAAFSHDGKSLAFVAKAGGGDALYVYDVARRKVVKTLEFKMNGLQSPTWSPDNQHIAFSGNVGGISDLYITDLNGDLQRLTNDKYAELLPAWSPDGKQIAITTDRGPGADFDNLSYGNFRIAIYDIPTGRIDLLPHQDQGKNINAVWSPDGSKLIWVNDRTGVNNLYLYDRQTTELSQITDLISGAIAVGPLSPVLTWSTQSGRMLFGHFEIAGYNIYGVDDPLKLERMPVVEAPVVVAATNGSSNGNTTAAPVQDPNAPIASYYKTSDGTMRASSTLPAGTEITTPISVAALLDSAAAMLPDTADFEHSEYKVKFSADMIGRPQIGTQLGGVYGNGVQGGTFITLSDMLGNHNILLAGNVSGTLSDASVLAGYSNLEHRINYGVAVSQQPYYYYGGTGYFPIDIRGELRDVQASIYQRDLYRSAQAGISYPFSQYSRVELTGQAIDFKSEYLFTGYDLQTGEGIQKTESLGQIRFAEPLAAYVFDNTLFGWTGPVVGRRFRLQASHALGDVQYAQGLVDFRNYMNYKQNLVFASRFIGLTRQGRDGDRFGNYWGNSYFLRGYDDRSFDGASAECVDSRFYSSEPSLSQCPVRDQLVGSNVMIMNTELRYPIVKELQVGFLGNFPPVDAVAFFDGGVAWSNKICLQDRSAALGGCTESGTIPIHLVWDRKAGQDPFLYREPLFSYGVGLRINVFYTILRLDYAVAMNRPDKKGVFSLGFGPSF